MNTSTTLPLQPPLGNDDLLEPPDSYEPGKEYFQHVAGQLPATWRLSRGATWTQAMAPRRGYRTQGWKIHVSCRLADATRMLSAVLARCCPRGTEFKFASDPIVHRGLLSKNIARSTGGKFITIYPNSDADFEALLAELYVDLAEFDGPYILSDRQYKDSKVLFYRYGGFFAFTETDVFGARRSFILDGEHRHVEDERTAAVIVPDFAIDKRWGQAPEEVVSASSEESPLMNGRYKMLSALKHSNVGGVYLAEDTASGATVIVREARPHTAPDKHGADSVSRLQREHRVLMRIKSTGAGPAAIDLFSEWDHHFLVQQRVDGITLRQFVATRSALILAQPAEEESRQWLHDAFTVASNLTTTVASIHRSGVVFGDISSNNIIVNPESMEVTLIDFETAFVPGEDFGGNAFTPGFGPREREGREEATWGDDLFSLGCALLALLVPSHVNIALIPDFATRALAHLERDFGVPARYSQIVLQLLAGSQDGYELEDIAAELAAMRVTTPSGWPSSDARERSLAGTADLDAILRFNRHVIDPTNPRRPLPLDPDGGAPLSFDHGLLGVAYAHLILDRERAEPLLDWARDRAHEGFALPGLLRGAAGMSWLLTAAGEFDLSAQVLGRLKDHPLLYHDYSLGYGIAGVGLSHLKLWHASNDDRQLQAAVAIADLVMASRVTTDAGCRWPGEAADAVNLGLHAGGLGTALFLIYLAAATSDPRHAAVAFDAVREELTHGREHAGLLGFPAVAFFEGPQDTIIYPYLSAGTAGVGHVLLRAQRLADMLELDTNFATELAKCRRSSVSKYATQAGLGMGLAGLGNFLLDVHQFTGEPSALADAWRVAEGLDLFKVYREQGLSFPTSSRAKVSVSYIEGSCGIGLFLHRLAHGAPNFHLSVDELLVPRHQAHVRREPLNTEQSELTC